MKGYQSIHDFLLDESFVRYVLKQDMADVQRWEAYIMHNPDKRQLLEQAKVTLLDMQQALSSIDAEESYQKLKPMLSEGELKELPKRRNWLYYAAASIAVLFISIASLWVLMDDDANHDATYATQPSQRKTITLADGTLIKLNADSKLEVMDGFGKTNRAIKLTGEAYMEVAKNPDLPFTIGTNTIAVRVLGTTLNIRAYANEDHAEASLLEGSAEVILKNKDVAPIRLKPMDKVVASVGELSNNSNDIRTELPDSTTYKLASMTHYDSKQRLVETSWTEQKLVFVNEPLSSIAKTLERWYNIKIEFDTEGIKDRKYTAAFDESEELQSVLESLKASMPFHYKKIGPRTISIN